MPSVETTGVDLEQGGHRRIAEDDEGSLTLCFSDTDEGSCHSEFLSAGGGCYGERSSEVEKKVDEVKVHLERVERDCRICHLGLESSSNECGVAIELGCSCKNDLAAAHKHCAEAWFKIKGNKTCEICHSIVRNVAGAHELEPAEQHNGSNNATVSTATVAASVAASTGGGRNFWQVHRVLNFLLACMVFAFVISWLFHFNVPS